MHQVREVRDAARTVTSLDRPVGEEDGASLGELFPSDDEEPVEEVDREVREEVVRRAVSELPDPEREIVRRRYGLADDRPQSVEQVVRSLGVSRAEVGRSSTARSSASPGAARSRRSKTSPDGQV